jgi:very-short-patch-repair endonuclease
MSYHDLPQVCCRCRNKQVSGKTRPASEGKFFRSRRHDRQDPWVCAECLARPNLGSRTPFRESVIERRVRQALQVVGISYRQEFQVGPFRFDFALPRMDLLVEVDSQKWHRSDFHRKRDKRKDSYARKNGWTVVRINNGPKLARRALEAIRDHQERLLSPPEDADDQDHEI